MYNLIERLYLRQYGNLAFYDSLTKTFNRNWWERNGKKHFQDKEIYLTMIDLNDLKETNDNLGHEAGDEKICKFVRVLNGIFDKKFLCRLGGDEFLLFTYDNPQHELEEIALLENFSFGIYHKKKEEPIYLATKQADKLMYEMKSEYHKK